jgi:hypothetical protein
MSTNGGQGSPVFPTTDWTQVRRFGFGSPAQAGNAFITAERMFIRLLRQVVGEYTGTGADVDEEIRDLRRELGEGR